MRFSRLIPMIMSLAATAVSAEPIEAYVVEGDAIMEPLTVHQGDAGRGEKLVLSRQTSLCLLCHQGPFPEPHMQGTLAPDLRGIGKRFSEGQIRLRIVDMAHLNPATIMPSYYRPIDHPRVAQAWRGRPVLEAQAIEDIVAFLMTLKE